MRRTIPVAVVVIALIHVGAAPVRSAGWHREEQGARATALAQAVTAQVEDPSAVYYNPAALAFFPDRAFALGFDLVHPSRAAFTGADPVPGAGEMGQRAIDSNSRPHFYWVEPVARRWAIGMALHQTAGFETAWDMPASWAGAFEARDVELTSWDLDAMVSRRFGESFGVAAGLVLRTARFDWARDEGVGVARLASETDTGIGGVIALQHRPTGRWSWGLRWRGGITSELRGSADLPMAPPDDWFASLDMPDRTTVGVAYSPTPTLELELDFDHTAWSSLGNFDVRFPDQPALDRTPVSGWRDRLATRIGIGWYGLGNGEWRAGLFSDPTPQPESGLGPFFVGADRLGASIGYGTRVRRLQTDLALVWEEHETRSTATHGFDGEYETRFLRLVLTFGW